MVFQHISIDTRGAPEAVENVFVLEILIVYQTSRSIVLSLRLFFQLTELVEQLKAQLELEEVSDNPDNIASVLTNLKHQGEATLDSIHTAIDEGESIIEELKFASTDGMDSSSLHHVEKVIKELDRVRRAIEHSWSRRRQQLELWLQLREFERAAKQVRTVTPLDSVCISFLLASKLSRNVNANTGLDHSHQIPSCWRGITALTQ